MAVWDSGAAALAPRSATPQSGHFRRGAGLVDKDQTLGVEVRLGLEPSYATGGDVGPFLLGCVRCFMGWPAPYLPALLWRRNLEGEDQ
jgi:hypothetical protein